MRKLFLFFVLMSIPLLTMSQSFAYEPLDPDVEFDYITTGIYTPTFGYQITQGNRYNLTIDGGQSFPSAQDPWVDENTMIIKANDSDYRNLVLRIGSTYYWYDIFNVEFKIFIDSETSQGVFPYDIYINDVLVLSGDTSGYGEFSIFILFSNIGAGTYEEGYQDGQQAYHNGFTGQFDITQSTPFNLGYTTGRSFQTDYLWTNGFSGTGYFDTTSFSYTLGNINGYNTARAEFGFNDSGVWRTANERYIVGLNEGVTNGMDQMFINGSANYSYNDENAFDYQKGFLEGSKQNVNVGATNFMNDFGRWIVPAIVVVILLGGFISVKKEKDRG